MGIEKHLQELSLLCTHSLLENKKDCIFRCSKKEGHGHIHMHELVTKDFVWRKYLNECAPFGYASL